MVHNDVNLHGYDEVQITVNFDALVFGFYARI